MFGRTGFLVHSYLVGPNGQSNGCISVKDYPKFLAAFQRGEVERALTALRRTFPSSLPVQGHYP